MCADLKAKIGPIGFALALVKNNANDNNIIRIDTVQNQDDFTSDNNNNNTSCFLQIYYFMRQVKINVAALSAGGLADVNKEIITKVRS